jgi:hypothetical protein
MGKWEWRVTETGDLERVPVGTPKPKPQPKAVEEDSPYPHGDWHRYFTANCRCQPCTQSATTYSKNKRHERYAKPDAAIPHGTDNGYKNYGCRCSDCTRAMRNYQRRYPESQQAKDRRNAYKRQLRAQKRAEMERHPH